jgi:mannose-6-phosphate isomerase-like protein (cupin superfamily)
LKYNLNQKKEDKMKNLIVKNLNQIQPKVINRNDNEFSVKSIIPDDETSKCRVNFVEVEPGNYAYGYHYHEANEEVFYIIRGTGIVRTPKGEITVNAGDAITFPAGADGAHVIRNGSETEKLVYIDFGTTIVPEIVHLPDFNQLMVIGKTGMGIYDEK